MKKETIELTAIELLEILHAIEIKVKDLMRDENFTYKKNSIISLLPVQHKILEAYKKSLEQ